VEKTRRKPEARLHAVVRGRVQGVGFRYYTTQAAQHLDLCGWVANRWDGRVETVAEGTRDALVEFLTLLHCGPSSAIVAQIDAEWHASTGEFERFSVRYRP
jgi:acylphosphatase